MSVDRHADPLVEHDYKVDALRKFLISGEVGLKDVPEALAKVLEEGAWRDRVDWKTRERFTFERFEDFVTAEPQAGLGATVEVVERLVRGDLRTERLLAGVLLRRPGGQTKEQKEERKRVNHVRRRLSTTDRSQLLRRLQRERPDLLARVEAGDLSAHAAAVEAGHRKRHASVPVDSPGAAVRALLRRFTADELRQALDKETPGR